jgi:hypothetical protein
MHRLLVALALLPLLHSSPVKSQTPPCSRLEGIVLDSTGALVPGASVSLDEKTRRASGSDGRFAFPCVTPGKHELTATIADFAAFTVRVTAPHTAELTFRLVPATQASVTVNADLDMQVPAPGGDNGLVISGKQLQALADDPDDLQRELQQLAAAAGGSPASTIISVDGFQDSAKLPPKSSIAYIQVTPDLFSPEYREPPFGGGRVEVFTKPGAKTYHGDLFATNSSSWMNARDPFATSAGKTGKQRYGFDLSGPIRKEGSSFTLSLEHRSIDEIAVVNTVDANNNPLLDSVPQPQALWIAQARADWQITPKNFAFITYSANANSTANVGVGGQVLREAGYGENILDQTVRASDVATISPHLMHEARASFEWIFDNDTPNTTGPSVQVSGLFTGGGATAGNTRQFFTGLENDDDIVLTTTNHTVKAGYQLFWKTRDSLLQTNFNGTYIYADGAQYLAQAPEQFSNVAGNPEVHTSQVRLAVFYADTMKLSDSLTFSYGLRYELQTAPATYNTFAPRLGFAWSPGKQKAWRLATHFGIFDDQYSMNTVEELNREDGIQRITSLVANPAYNNPFLNATPIHSERTLGPNTNPGVYTMGDASISRDLPFGFNLNAELVLARFLTYDRTVNINQPLNGNPYGPRPFAPDLNILQVTNNGTGQGHGEFFSLSNFKLKRVQFFLGALHLNLRDNTDDSALFQPQSAYTDAGEQAPRDNQPQWMVFTNGTFVLPAKLSLSLNGHAGGDQPFNITTGIDNNGDGNFNDRPQFAAPGSTPGSTPNGATVFATPFGLLTNNGPIVNGAPLRPIVRNTGRLPWSYHVDANLQRAFVLTRNSKADHQQTLTANIRSANLLNHTNVTTEGSVLGSPQFLQPIAADTARRIEFGLRYAF